MKLNTIQLETCGDGANGYTYRRNNIAEINMNSKSSGYVEKAPYKVIHKAVNVHNTAILSKALKKDNDQHNSQLLQYPSSKSAHNFSERNSQINGTNCKSSSEHHIMLRDTPRSNNNSIQSTKPFEKSDDDLTVRSLILSKNGYYNSQESLSLSITSMLSSQSHEDNETINARRVEHFNDWLKKKEDEKKAKIAKMKTFLKPDKTKIAPEQKEALFRKWLEKKQSIKDANKTKLLTKSQQDEERKKQKELGKEEKLNEWNKKKLDILKDIKISEIQRTTAIQQAKELKRKENEKAYQKWLQESKTKPLPVPLNRGKLSMRSTLSVMYINPEPWKFSTDEQVETAE